MDIDLDNGRPFTLQQIRDYPVALAVHHWHMSGLSTPISGDHHINNLFGEN